MNIFRRAAIGVAALAMAGTTLGLVTASSASAAGPFVEQSTTVETSANFIAPNVEVLTFNNYQPSVLPPGFRLWSQTTELCLVGPLRSVCTWRLTTNAPPLLSKQLRGNAVIPRIGFGQRGLITGGTKSWFGARGVFRAVSLAPNVSADTWVFTTP
jgi:hypothetical protein